LRFGGPPFGGPPGGGAPFTFPQPGQILSPFTRDQLKFTAEEKKQLAELQKEIDGKLDGMLQDEQKKQLKQMQDFAKSFGFPGGPPGGPPGGGPPGGGPPGAGGPGGSPGGFPGFGPAGGVGVFRARATLRILRDWPARTSNRGKPLKSFSSRSSHSGAPPEHAAQTSAAPGHLLALRAGAMETKDK
jgi:hypothetical protein